MRRTESEEHPSESVKRNEVAAPKEVRWGVAKRTPISKLGAESEIVRLNCIPASTLRGEEGSGAARRDCTARQADEIVQTGDQFSLSTSRHISPVCGM